MVTVHTGAETIQGRKLFKGGNYMRKYGMYNGHTICTGKKLSRLFTSIVGTTVKVENPAFYYVINPKKVLISQISVFLIKETLSLLVKAGVKK